MKKNIILDLCGGSGSWGKPWADAGYDVRLITLPEYDVRTYVPPEGVLGVLAAPPCQEFSIAKNHDIKRDIEGGMEIVNACLRIIKEAKPDWWALENPVGLLQKQIGPAQFSFQPWEFGDPWTKRTMIWGEFKKPVKRYKKWEDVPKIDLYIRPTRTKPAIASLHLASKKLIPQLDVFPADNDAAFRAITPPSFAVAFYEANR